MSPAEDNIKKNDIDNMDLEELVILNHSFTHTEHNTIVQALKSFLNTALIPITQKPTNMAISALKRQKSMAESLLQAINSYSEEMAVSEKELSILKRALRGFMSLPKPLWQDINQIRKMKNYQDTAATLLDTFDLEEL
ncbi:MAG: hypothetical protein ACW981_15570 [Candidatus Hodarchaeales archaeon]|jgi:hypothetical protein